MVSDTSPVITIDGAGGFPHVDRSGAQRQVSETFEKLAERLSATDPVRRMPLQREMDSAEREELYLWARRQAR